MTAALYARRKGWPLAGVTATVVLDGAIGAARPRVRLALHLGGDLDAAQAERLRAVARRCPVHRLLAGEAEILGA